MPCDDAGATSLAGECTKTDCGSEHTRSVIMVGKWRKATSLYMIVGSSAMLSSYNFPMLMVLLVNTYDAVRGFNAA
jgi:hypothetical protein